jgi:hypothetical protein
LSRTSSARQHWPTILTTPLAIISIHLDGMKDAPSIMAYHHIYHGSKKILFTSIWTSILKNQTMILSRTIFSSLFSTFSALCYSMHLRVSPCISVLSRAPLCYSVHFRAIPCHSNLLRCFRPIPSFLMFPMLALLCSLVLRTLSVHIVTLSNPGPYPEQ